MRRDGRLEGAGARGRSGLALASERVLSASQSFSKMARARMRCAWSRITPLMLLSCERGDVRGACGHTRMHDVEGGCQRTVWSPRARPTRCPCNSHRISFRVRQAGVPSQRLRENSQKPLTALPRRCASRTARDGRDAPPSPPNHLHLQLGAGAGEHLAPIDRVIRAGHGRRGSSGP